MTPVALHSVSLHSVAANSRYLATALSLCRWKKSLQKRIALHGGVAATLTPIALHCATKFMKTPWLINTKKTWRARLACIHLEEKQSEVGNRSSSLSWGWKRRVLNKIVLSALGSLANLRALQAFKSLASRRCFMCICRRTSQNYLRSEPSEKSFFAKNPFLHPRDLVRRGPVAEKPDIASPEKIFWSQTLPFSKATWDYPFMDKRHLKTGCLCRDNTIRDEHIA